MSGLGNKGLFEGDMWEELSAGRNHISRVLGGSTHPIHMSNGQLSDELSRLADLNEEMLTPTEQAALREAAIRLASWR